MDRGFLTVHTTFKGWNIMNGCFGTINPTFEGWNFVNSSWWIFFNLYFWNFTNCGFFAVHTTFKGWYIMNGCFLTVDATIKGWSLMNGTFFTIDCTCKFWDFMDFCFCSIFTTRDSCTFKTYRQIMHALNCTINDFCNFLTNIFLVNCKKQCFCIVLRQESRKVPICQFKNWWLIHQYF